jgi:hypothetical protein
MESTVAEGVIGSTGGVGNKVRDCAKNPRAKELAVKAITVSDGFMGTPILDCNEIHSGLKSPETGVSYSVQIVLTD